MNEEQLQLLWDLHAKSAGFKDIGEFKSLMQNDNARKVYFDSSNKQLGFKDYNDFNLTLQKKSLGSGGLSQSGSTPIVKMPKTEQLKQAGLDMAKVFNAKVPDNIIVTPEKAQAFKDVVDAGYKYKQAFQNGVSNEPTQAKSNQDEAAKNYQLAIDKLHEVNGVPSKVDTEQAVRNFVEGDQSSESSFVNDPGAYLNNFAGHFNQAVISSATSIPKSIGILASKLDKTLGVRDGSAENYGTYQIGDFIDKKALEWGITATDPKKDNFLTSDVASGLGSVMAIMLSGGESALAGESAGLTATQLSQRKAISEGIKDIGKLLTKPGAVVGSTSMAVPEFEAAKKAGLSDDEALGVFAKNYFVGATEILPIENALHRVNKLSGRKLIEVAEVGFKGGVEEGIQEIVQQTLTNKIAQGSYDPDRDLFQDVIRSGGAGFFIGFILPGIGAAMQHMTPDQKAETQVALNQSFIDLKTQQDTSAAQQNDQPDVQTDQNKPAGSSGSQENIAAIPEQGSSETIPTEKTTATEASQPIEQPPYEVKPVVGTAKGSNFDYTPNKDLTPEQSLVEQKFAKDLDENYQARKEEYVQKFGNVIDADNARTLSPDYVSDPEKNSISVHRPASSFLLQVYKDMLAEPAPEGKKNLVVFVGGGAGAGKSTLNVGSVSEAQIIQNTNMAPYQVSKNQINRALNAGKDVEVNYVYRDPIDSFENGVVPRAIETGRAISIKEFIRTHLDSRETIKKLQNDYAGDNKVKINVIDNTKGKGQEQVSSFDKIKITDTTPEQLSIQLNTIADNLFKDGKISEQLYNQFTGKGGSEADQSTQQTNPDGTSGGIAPGREQRTDGTTTPIDQSETKGTQPKAVVQHITLAKEKVIEIFGENYVPKSHQESYDLAQEFIKEMGGIDNAYSAIKEDTTVVPGDLKQVIIAEKLDKLRVDMETDPGLQAEYIQIMGDWADKNTESGRESSIMSFIYQNYGLMFTASNQIAEYKNKNGGISEEIEKKFREWGELHEKLEKTIKQQNEEISVLKDKISVQDISDSINRKGRVTRGEQKIKEARKTRDDLKKDFLKTLKGGALQASIIPGLSNEQFVIAVKIAKTFLDEFNGNIQVAIENTRNYLNEALGKALTEEAIDAIRKEIDPVFIFDGVKIQHSSLINLVKEGYNTPEKLVPKVLELLQKDYPSITEQQVKDLISGYGKTVNPSKDELEIKLAKIKRLVRLQTVIDSLHKNIRPLKTGVQRAKMEADERTLMREARNLMKELPIDDDTKNNQLKTALDTKKQRIKNRLDDLQKAIDSQTEVVHNRKQVTDEELENLIKQKEDLQEVYDTTFNTPDKLESERIAATVKSLEESIAKTIKRIDSNLLETATAKRDKVSSDRITELKEILKSTKTSLEFLRKESGIAEMERLDYLASNAKKAEEIYKLKLKTGDFSRRKVKNNYNGFELNDAYARLDEKKENLKYANTKDKAQIQKEIDSLDQFIKKVKEVQKNIASRDNVRNEFIKEQYKAELAKRNKFWDSILELTTGLPRQLNAGFEFSIVGVQFALPTINTIRKDVYKLIKSTATRQKADYDTPKNFAQMFRSWYRKEAHQEFMDFLKSKDYYQRAKASGLNIREQGAKLQAKEEGFQSNWVGHIFDSFGHAMIKLGFKKVGHRWIDTNISAKFERSAHAYANMVRIQQWVLLEEKIRKEGKNFVEHKDEYKAAANAINTATGSTSLGALDASSQYTNAFFYSTKLLASTLKEVSPLALYHVGSLHTNYDKPTISVMGKEIPGYKVSVAQKYAVSNLIAGLGTLSLITLGVASMLRAAGGDDEDFMVDLDPHSSHWMQIRKKGTNGRITYIDPISRWRTAITLQARLLPMILGGGITSNKTGELRIPGEPGVPTRAEIGLQYVMNKTAPIPSYVYQTMSTSFKYDEETETWEPYLYGKEFEYDQKFYEKVYPMYFGTLWELGQYQSPEFAAFGTLFSGLGVSFNTFDETPKEEE